MSTASGSAQILDDLALAHALADLADAITLDRYQAQDLVIATKPDNTPVTDADRAVETAIREALATHRTSDGLVGEEFGSDKGSSGRYWVIDPIDGTKNFMRGVPTWATLIALVQVDADGNEEVVVGIASAPALARRWAAAKGHGATVRFNSGESDFALGDTSGDDFVYSSTSNELDTHTTSIPSLSLAPNEKRISVSKVSSLSDASISYSDFVGWGDRLEHGEPVESEISGHTCWLLKVQWMSRSNHHLLCGIWLRWTSLFAKQVEALQIPPVRVDLLVAVGFPQMAFCTTQL
jgi:fructose-1,6-bisphosphatase/inositol monophosphatase family enzyme